MSCATVAGHASHAALTLTILAPNGVLQDCSHPFARRVPAITSYVAAKIDDLIALLTLTARHNGTQ